MRISIIIFFFFVHPLASCTYIGEQVTTRLPEFPFVFPARWPTIEKDERERKKSIVSFNDDIILNRALNWDARNRPGSKRRNREKIH